MADIRITDLVDPQAIADLKELDETLQAVRKTYVSAAQELLKGIKMPVEGMDDIRKMNESLTSQSKKAAQATGELSQAMEKHQETVARTTNEISRELAAIEKENSAKRASYQVSQEAVRIAEIQNGTMEENAERLAKVEQQIRANRASEQAYIALQRQSTQQLQAGLLSRDEYNKQLAKTAPALATIRQEGISLSTQKRELLLVMNNEMKASQAAEGSYKQLSLQLELMKKAYKDMDEAEKSGANGQKLKEGIEGLDAHLKDLAAGMGEFQRNVGNYAIAGESAGVSSKNLSASVQGIVRELPSATMGLQTFFLAISNNIPVLQDAIKSYNEQKKAAEGVGEALKDAGDASEDAGDATEDLSDITDTLSDSSEKAADITEKMGDAMAATGKKAGGIQSAFSVIMKSLFSWQTLLTVGITLLSMYGGKIVEWIKGLFDGGEAAKEAAKRQKEFDDTMKKASDTYMQTLAANTAQNLASYRKLQAGYAALGNDMKAKKVYIMENASAIEQLGYKVDTVTQAEAFFRGKTQEVIKSFKLRAQAAAYAAESVEIYRKAIQVGQQKVWKPKVGERIKTNDLADYGFSNDEIRHLGETQPVKKYGNALMGAGTGYLEITKDISDRIYRYLAQPALDMKNQLTKQADQMAAKGGQLEKEAADVVKRTGLGGGGKATGTGGGGHTTTTHTTTTSHTGGGGGGTDYAALENARAKALEEARKKTDELLLEQQQTAQQERTDVSISGMEDQTKKELAELEKDEAEKRNAIKESAKKMGEALAAEAYAAYLAKNPKNNFKGWKNTKEGKMTGDDWTKAITDSKTDISGFDKRTQDNMLAARKTYNDRLVSMEEDTQQKLKDIREDAAERQSDKLADDYAMEAAKRNETYRTDMLNLRKQLSDKKITQDEYDKEVSEKSSDYAVETAKNSVSLIQSQLQVENLSAEKRKELQKNLMKAMGDLAEAEAQKEQKATEEKTKAQQKHMEKVKDIMGKVSDALNKVNALGSAIFDGRIQAVEAEEKEEQDHYDKEVERIQNLADSGVITTEEAEARKRVAQEKTEKKNEELEKKKQQIQRKQAIWNKMNSIAQVGIATALGIMQALAMWPPNIPLAAFVGAMGAIQLATILATPIPKYAKGTKDHKGGLAIVGDAGKQEIVMHSGKYWVTPDKPTLVDIPRGAEVLPDINAVPDFSELGKQAGPDVVVNNDYGTLQRELARRLDRNNALLKASIIERKRSQSALSFSEYKRLNL